MASATAVQRPVPAPVYLPPLHRVVPAEPAVAADAVHISFVTERSDANGVRTVDVVRALQSDTIQDVKLRLRTRGHRVSNGHALVFGDRTLAEHEVVGELMGQLADADAAGYPYRHIFVRLRDIDAVSLTTMQRTVSFDTSVDVGAAPAPADGGPRSLEAGPTQSRSPRSALTALIDSQPNSVVLRNGSGSLSDFSAGGPAFGSDTVVHLVIRKSAKIDWRLAGSKVELSISAGACAGRLTEKAEAAGGVLRGAHQLLYNGEVLVAGKSLGSYGIQQGAVLELVPVEAEDLPDGSPTLSSPDHELFEDWQAARAGLAAGSQPRLAAQGTGGSYFLSNASGRNVAVFKPQDEEPGAVFNPRGHSGSGDAAGSALRRGVRPGEGALREVAAFLLDRAHFAGVPPTALVSCQPQTLDAAVAAAGGPPAAADGALAVGVKVGSLQQFVHADSDCEDRGPAPFPVQEVHKIAQLDLRLANTDRNGGNILARCKTDGSWQLIPIDHGYTLPSTFADVSFEWLYWPQARAPFSAATRAYIAGLSSEADLATLAAHHLRLSPESERVFKASTMLLQKGAARGLSPYAIGLIMCREEETVRSPMEGIHANALQLATSETSAVVAGHGAALMRHATVADTGAFEAAYVRHLGALLDEYLDDLVLEGMSAGVAA